MTNVTIGPPGTDALPTANSIDPANDYLPIYTASVTETQGINRNTLLGVSGTPADISSSQTFTNKTLTSPTINGATLSGTLSGTYTIGGTPTFPSSVVTLSGTQTLTNKTLTSPTINSPTIANATISADAVSGYTTSNAGTIYGISVSGGHITNAAIANGTIGSTQIATNGVAASNLATNAITLGTVSISTTPSSASTSYVLITGMSVQVTVPSGGRKVELDLSAYSIYTSGAQASIAIYRGATSGALTTLVQDTICSTSLGLNSMVALDSPSAGTYYYSVAYKTSNASDAVAVSVGSGNSVTLIVKAI